MKNEMGRACSKYGEKLGCLEGFGEESLGIETTWKT
jgi:hypothetical protein